MTPRQISRDEMHAACGDGWNFMHWLEHEWWVAGEGRDQQPFYGVIVQTAERWGFNLVSADYEGHIQAFCSDPLLSDRAAATSALLIEMHGIVGPPGSKRMQ